jgi:hypothetical protein
MLRGIEGRRDSEDGQRASVYQVALAWGLQARGEVLKYYEMEGDGITWKMCVICNKDE